VHDRDEAHATALRHLPALIGPIHSIMWFADIYCDAIWVRERNGLLGPPRSRLRGTHSQSLGIMTDFLFFGDDEAVRHIRVLMHTDEHHVADTCENLNIQTWVNALEAAVMLQTNRPFRVLRVPRSPQTFVTVLGRGDEQSPAAVISFTAPDPKPVDYQSLAVAFGAWSADTSPHLFYLRRFIDPDLPLDVRWLNGYRLLEWHFVKDGSFHLSKSDLWKQFVARFEAQLTPLCRPNQKAVSLLEEARIFAAHAGRDDRSDAERASQQENAMERTFRVLESMVIVVLNEHPSRPAHIKWIPRNDVHADDDTSP
jgi:hypothetical protein